MNGIYKASFAVGIGSGQGIVVLRDGYAAGGDYGFTYEGGYEPTEHGIEGTLLIKQWDATVPNVFNGLTHFSLTFTGKPQGNGFVLIGKTSSAPGQLVNVVLHRLS